MQSEYFQVAFSCSKLTSFGQGCSNLWHNVPVHMYGGKHAEKEKAEPNDLALGYGSIVCVGECEGLCSGHPTTGNLDHKLTILKVIIQSMACIIMSVLVCN